MLRQFLVTILLMMLFLCAKGQKSTIGGLLLQLNNAKSDTGRLIVLRSIARAYAEKNTDSTSYFAEESLKLSRKLAFRIDEGGAIQEIGYAFVNKGNWPG